MNKNRQLLTPRLNCGTVATGNALDGGTLIHVWIF